MPALAGDCYAGGWRAAGRDRGRDGLPAAYHPADRPTLPREWAGRAGGWSAAQPRRGAYSHGGPARSAPPDAPAYCAGWWALDWPESGAMDRGTNWQARASPAWLGISPAARG